MLFAPLRCRLAEGDHIKVTASKYPFPTVCADKASTDWFSSISRTLRWNEREKQKSFVVVEEASDPPERSGDRKEDAKKDLFEEGRAKQKFEKDAKVSGDLVESEDEEDDEEEIFDIDE